MKKYHTPELLIDTAETGVVMTSLETGKDTGIQMSGELDLDKILEG